MASINTRKAKDGTKSYRVMFRTPEGEQRSKTFDLMKDARVFAATVERDKAHGEYIPPEGGRTRFADYAEKVNTAKALNQRASTQASDQSVFDSVVLPHFGNRYMGAVTPREVQEWVTNTAGKYSPSTTRKAHQLLANVFAAAVEDGLISRTPCRNVTLPKPDREEQRFLTVDEINRLADTIEPRYRALVLTGAYTGARFGELAALQIGRNGLDLLRRRLTVRKTLNEVRGHIVIGEPKSPAAKRAITIPAYLVDELARHLEHYPGQDGYVFTSHDGKPIRRNNFRRRVWMPAVEAADLDGLVFHQLRHTAASLLIAAGLHPKVISSRLGHAKIATTMDLYGHLFEGLDQEAADKLDALIAQ